MTKAFSAYLEKKVLDQVLRNVDMGTFATNYVALLNVLPGTGDPNTYTECSGGSYGRAAALAASFATTASGGGSSTISNTAALTFPAPTGNWTQAVGWGIFDAQTAGTGNLLIFEAFATAVTVNSGSQAPSFAIGALTCTLD